MRSSAERTLYAARRLPTSPGRSSRSVPRLGQVHLGDRERACEPVIWNSSNAPSRLPIFTCHDGDQTAEWCSLAPGVCRCRLVVRCDRTGNRSRDRRAVPWPHEPRAGGVAAQDLRISGSEPHGASMVRAVGRTNEACSYVLHHGDRAVIACGSPDRIASWAPSWTAAGIRFRGLIVAWGRV